MNIFVLSNDPRSAAHAHCDRHVVKMIVEYAQLMSTAHRLLDGTVQTFQKPDGKTQKLHLLEGEHAVLISKMAPSHRDQKSEFKLQRNPYKFSIQDPKCYGVTHANHPCAVWARESSSNYLWLLDLFTELCQEYTRRYKREHKTHKDLYKYLSRPPLHLDQGGLTPFPQTMPDEYRNEDTVHAYQNYYVGAKASFARWTNRQVPTWFKNNIKDYDASNFERTSTVA